VLAVALLTTVVGLTHAQEAGFRVLVDTDAAVDDLRALCLLLATPQFEILAITTSDGALAPKQGAGKTCALLESLKRESIPVAAGPDLLTTPPPWRSFAQRVTWGDSETVVEYSNRTSATELMVDQLRCAEKPIVVVCLGPLTNLADAVRTAPDIESKIEKILWYNDELHPPSGTNYGHDPEAADFLLETGVPMDVISNVGRDAWTFDEAFLSLIESIDTPCAQRIAVAHRDPEVLERIRTGHLRLWDELLPVHLSHPELFRMEKLTVTPHLRISRSFDGVAVKEEIIRMLGGHAHDENVLFLEFPDDPDLFTEDLRPHVRDIIRRHGHEEWRLCVLTTEFHQHLGIYSIVGAKMGLRARDILGAGMDELEVVSYAGTGPPLSCLNDGLQVSTGSSLGHGAISIADDPETRPEAAFKYSGGVLRLRLKPEHWDQIRDDIAQGIDEHGLNTPAYFDFIRQLGIRYWLEWGREDIFLVERVD